MPIELGAGVVRVIAELTFHLLDSDRFAAAPPILAAIFIGSYVSAPSSHIVDHFFSTLNTFDHGGKFFWG